MKRPAARKLLFLGILVLVVCYILVLPGLAQSAYPEPEDNYVNDFAGLLAPADREQIRLLWQDLEAQTGVEGTVATVASFRDYDTGATSFETFATTLFNEWGVGNLPENDGVMILLSLEERMVRIELGAGYDRSFDSRMKRIIDDVMIPYFRDGDYSPGLVAGVKAVTVALVDGYESPLESRGRPEINEVEVSADPAVESGRRFVLPDVGVGLPLLALVGSLVGYVAWRNYRRYRPRPCPQCGTEMARMEEVRDDQWLNEGQRTEERLGSVDYDVWLCPSCDEHTIERYGQLWSSYGDCPECGYRTVKTTSQVVQQATYSHSGLKRITESCRRCSYRYSRNQTIPRRERSSSSSSFSSSGSSFSSSSSGSFGGGSSSGGGASGSW